MGTNGNRTRNGCSNVHRPPPHTVTGSVTIFSCYSIVQGLMLLSRYRNKPTSPRLTSTIPSYRSSRIR